MQDGAERRGDGERYRVRDGVVRVNELDAETAQLDGVARADMVQLDLLGHLVLGELGLDDAAGQARCVNRCVALTQHIRDRADVVLVAVGDDVAAQLVQVALEVGRVRDNEVYAEHIIVRECYAAVDYNDVAAVLDNGHVLADLVQTAKRYDLQFFFHNGFITFLYQSKFVLYLRGLVPQKTDLSFICLFSTKCCYRPVDISCVPTETCKHLLSAYHNPLPL